MRLGRKKGLGAQLAGGGWRELSSRVHSVNNATTHALSSSFTFRISALSFLPIVVVIFSHATRRRISKSYQRLGVRVCVRVCVLVCVLVCEDSGLHSSSYLSNSTVQF